MEVSRGLRHQGEPRKVLHALGGGGRDRDWRLLAGLMLEEERDGPPPLVTEPGEPEG